MTYNQTGGLGGLGSTLSVDVPVCNLELKFEIEVEIKCLILIASPKDYCDCLII